MTVAPARIVDVSKTYGHGRMEVRALDDVSLELNAGELTLIEGPSGSGKTTLLHIIGLLQTADAGEIWIGGQRVENLTQSALTERRRDHVAMVFQVYNLLDALTAEDNVALAGMLGEQERFSPALAQTHLADVNLKERGNHLPSQLSGGERQRVAIARALASPGQLVLADEPTANLDWENAREVIESLERLAHEKGKAVVVVSHDSRLEPYADRIVSLLDGRIVNDARKREPDMTPPPSGPQSSQTSRRGPRRRGVARWGVLALCAVMLILGWMVGKVVPWGALPTGASENSAPSSLSPATQPASGSTTPYVAAAPAVVEPSNKLVELRSERRGRIEAIHKQAGDAIHVGEPLVQIDEATARAAVAEAEAELALAKARLSELVAWDRPEEQARAEARVEYAQARYDRAERELKRIRDLFEKKTALQVELDDAEEELRLAASELEQARQARTISQSGPTEAELNVAKAQVDSAQAALELARTELGLLTIKSPLDGHVVYRHLEPGEVVDPEVNVPILSIGNLDDVRLRAEVDEADIERVRVGQHVEATAEAFGERVLHGRVVHLEPMMGRKTIRTQRTTEQQDTKVREVLIELDTGELQLPIDLQMTVRFIGDEDTSPAVSQP